MQFQIAWDCMYTVPNSLDKSKHFSKISTRVFAHDTFGSGENDNN